MTTYNEFLQPDEVLRIISNLTVDDGAFIVGGQATALWAIAYESVDPEISEYGPFTTKDVDYYGGVEAAEKLAAAIGGRVLRPSKDTMNSNSTALVEAKINDKLVLIDFLHGIIGVQRKEFDKGIAVIQIKAQDGQLVEVPLLHPVLCLKSRFANMISMATRRRDEIATRQTHTAVKVLKVHISEALKDGDHKEAVTCLQELLHYLESDHFGRNAHIDPGIDALDIAKLFVNDAGLKQIWRERSLIPAIDRIEAKRAERAQRIQAREH